MNTDFIFACRVCHNPLLASASERGAIVECPNCSGSQTIPLDPAFGASPSTYLSDATLLGDSTNESPSQNHPLLRRVRPRRDTDGQVLKAQTVPNLRALPSGDEPPEDTAALRAELERLRQLASEQNRVLAEWQTCHDSVERELKRADERANALQTKINATSNELAQTRHELNRVRAEADAARKANEALNRQLQGILKANQAKPPVVAVHEKSARPRKTESKAA